VPETIAALKRQDRTGASDTVIKDLAVLLTANPADLSGSRPALITLAGNAGQPAVRRAAWAGVVAADGRPDTAWTATSADPAARGVLIDSIILLLDPSLRATFQPLLTGAIADAQTPARVRAASLQALPLMGADNAPKNFGILASQLREGRDLKLAAQAIKQLPRDSWNREQAAPAAEAILAWARKVPADQRSGDDFVETVQTGSDLAALLPQADSTRIRKELMGLGVRVFAIKTIREQMRFDTPRLVVEAGKPFEIVFENNDMMPHNLVVVLPGAREEVGAQAQTMPPKPDRDGRMYVPKNDKILAASKMLEPGQKERLKLTAPKTPGECEYVCTYPEHWKVMFGQLLVVENMDAFLQSSASAPPPVQSTTVAHQHPH
jgi:azurin